MMKENKMEFVPWIRISKAYRIPVVYLSYLPIIYVNLYYMIWLMDKLILKSYTVGSVDLAGSINTGNSI